MRHGILLPLFYDRFSALALGTMIAVTKACVFAAVPTLEVSVAGSVAVTASFGGEENHIFLLGDTRKYYFVAAESIASDDHRIGLISFR
nr:hypothetical protein [Tanacetum cinerariifolium]